jgi:hypothetical protein
MARPEKLHVVGAGDGVLALLALLFLPVYGAAPDDQGLAGQVHELIGFRLAWTTSHDTPPFDCRLETDQRSGVHLLSAVGRRRALMYAEADRYRNHEHLRRS